MRSPQTETHVCFSLSLSLFMQKKLLQDVSKKGVEIQSVSFTLGPDAHLKRNIDS